MGKGGGKGGGEGCDLFFGSFYCACFLLFLGPLVLFIGVLVIGTSVDDTRGKKIHEYNVKVEEWRSKIKDSPFAEANFSAQLSYAGCGGSQGWSTNFTLHRGERPFDYLRDGSKDNAEPLVPQLKYFSGANVDVNEAKDCKVTVTFWSPKGKELARVTETLAQAKMNYCSTPNGLVECRRLCDRQGGSLIVPRRGTPQCIIRRELRSVCVKVAYDEEEGDFRADYLVPQSDDPSDEKGYGCFYRSRNHGYLVKGTRMVFAAAEFKGVNQQELDWRGNRTVQVIVRDRSDPWLHYLRITDGKGKFGLSTESKLIIGFSFLTLGILLTAMEIKAFSFICYYKRNPEARRPRNTILGTYYDLAHRNKRGETTGIPVVTTVPPAQQHFVQNPHYIHGPQHGSGSVEMQPASSARQGETSYSVIGTPLYITR